MFFFANLVSINRNVCIDCQNILVWQPDRLCGRDRRSGYASKWHWCLANYNEGTAGPVDIKCTLNLVCVGAATMCLSNGK